MKSLEQIKSNCTITSQLSNGNIIMGNIFLPKWNGVFAVTKTVNKEQVAIVPTEENFVPALADISFISELFFEENEENDFDLDIQILPSGKINITKYIDSIAAA